MRRQVRKENVSRIERGEAGLRLSTLQRHHLVTYCPILAREAPRS